MHAQSQLPDTQRWLSIHDRSLVALTLAGLCLSLVGCGQQGPPRVAVSGTVMLDGELLPSGTIHFVPTGQQGPLVAATVEDGYFELPEEVGPLAGESSVDIQVIQDLGFDLDDEEAYAAAARKAKRAPSPLATAVAFRDQASRQLTLDGDQSDLEFDLVTIKKRNVR